MTIAALLLSSSVLAAAGPAVAADAPSIGIRSAGDSSVSASSGAPSPIDDAIGSGAEDGWSFRLSPYLWIPAMDGHVTVKGATAPVDLSLGDTLDLLSDHLNFAAAVRVQVRHGDLTLFGDAMYMSLKADDIATASLGVATLRADQGIFELGAAHVVHESARTDDTPGFRLEPLAGARIYTFREKLISSLAFELAASQAWVDGFVGARATFDFHDGLGAHLRADIGAGGSDLCWNVEAGLDFGIADHATLHLGYRALSVDYGTGAGADRFEYDIVLHGPFAAISLDF